MSTRREAAIEAILAQQQEKREELERLRAALEETEQDMVELDTAMAGLEAGGIGGDVIVNVPQQPAPDVNITVPVPEVNVAAPQVTINPELNITGLVDLINRISALESTAFNTQPPEDSHFDCVDVANCGVIQDLQTAVNNLQGQTPVGVDTTALYDTDQRMLYNEERLDQVIKLLNIQQPGLLDKPAYTPITP